MGDLQGDLGDLQLRFWTRLLNRALEKGVRHHARCRPVRESFLSAGAGRTGLTIEYQIYNRDTAAVQLYLSHEEAGCNDARYKWLEKRRSEIEDKLGLPLQYYPAKNTSKKRSCSVQCLLPGGGLRDAGDRWQEVQERMIDTMDRFVQVVQPYIDNLPC